MAHMNCSALPVGPRAIDDESHGPGWFDSSWDLGRGLQVREGLPADAGFEEWLVLCLAN